MDVAPFRRAAALAPAARTALRRAFGIPEDAFVVTSAARLEPRKGQSFLLEAARPLAQRFPRVRFLLAGEGPERAALERQAAHPALRGKVIFPGYVEDLAPVLGLSDAFCLTSLWEGLPRVLVQASLTGLPVVTFGVEGAAEVVRNGESGWIVEPRDVPALTRALETLVWDPARARAMGRRGAGLVADEWDARRMVARIADVYDELLARRAVRASSALASDGSGPAAGPDPFVGCLQRGGTTQGSE
jgi:glycosyltransferase involved in cell wall biosynthesis